MSRRFVGVARLAATLATVGLVSSEVATAAGRGPEPSPARAVAAKADPQGLTGIVRVDGRPARDVVIWLDAPAAPFDPARTTALLDQRNMQFVPRLLAVRAGTTVRMPNSDRLLHNVFSFRDARVFDLGLYPTGTTKAVTFDKPGVSRIFCNIHPTMAAYVVSVDSPYFAVSDANGRFSISDVPDGVYTYHAWRAGAERSTATLHVVSGQPVQVNVP